MLLYMYHVFGSLLGHFHFFVHFFFTFMYYFLLTTLPVYAYQNQIFDNH